jgi:glycogen debranching enzyme
MPVEDHSTSPPPSLGPLGELTCLAGRTFCVSGTTGQIRAGGEQGLYVEDVRVLNRLLVRIDGAQPFPLRGHLIGVGAARFTAYAPASPQEDQHPDPTLLLDRRRVVSRSLWEELRLVNFGARTRVRLEVEAGSDFAYVFDVKHGRSLAQAPAEPHAGGLRLVDGDLATALRPSVPADRVEGGVLTWEVELGARDEWTLDLLVGAEEPGRTRWPSRSWAGAHVSSGGHPEPFPRRPAVVCGDQRFSQLWTQSIEDLGSLLVPDPEAPEDAYLAAGTPWYLTLFGRDSLWTALMALPLGADLAGQALRVLARRQGTTHDPETEEAPGKIVHEIRRGALIGRGDLPPRYYGTMDATPLFVTLLSEAWRWGLPEDEVERLLPAAQAALGWLRDDADPDGDGFLEYAQTGRRGLRNQGWKDSADGVQFADGRLAEPPIALCEVQGYAYEAALRGAELLDHFGLAGADEWRSWAARLQRRFREAFWVDSPTGAYPAIALDGDKRRVDSVSSNIGHLPGTGLLGAGECALVARRLAGPDMDSGWGLRTLSGTSARFNPLSYHGGSVWPHDTAIAVAGLAASGHGEVATSLLQGLVSAAPHFDYRLPELFGGEQRFDGAAPLPYPAACRPQAWAAGSALLLARAALGLRPHVPAGRLVLRPLWPTPFAQLRLRGIELGGGRLDVSIERDRGVTVHEAPPGLHVEVEGPARMPAERRGL